MMQAVQGMTVALAQAQQQPSSPAARPSTQDGAAAAAAAAAVKQASMLAACYTCYCYGLSMNATHEGQASTAGEALALKAQCSPFIAPYAPAEVVQR